jgi:hypothetical protein
MSGETTQPHETISEPHAHRKYSRRGERRWGTGTVTVGFDCIEDFGAESDLGEVVDVGTGEQEEFVGQNQVPLLLPLVAGAVHLARRRSLGSGGGGASFPFGWFASIGPVIRFGWGWGLA